jgi:hypothetical protein
MNLKIDDRDEIRRKLASITYTSRDTGNLQICFMNSDDNYNDDDNLNENKRELAQFKHKNRIFIKIINETLFEHESLKKLKNDLIETSTQAKIQITNELSSFKKVPSPINEIIGISTYGLKALTRYSLVQLNLGQLQLILNDLLNQIENTNYVLRELLIKRDDLLIKQDSLLIDLEDLVKHFEDKVKKCSNRQVTIIKDTQKTHSNVNNFHNSYKKKLAIQFGQFTSKLYSKLF